MQLNINAQVFTGKPQTGNSTYFKSFKTLLD